jgi:hypothetical protein
MSFRVIYHEPVCPGCGSSGISTEEVDITGGLTETAFVCGACHLAWPLACVSDLEARP